MVNSGLFELHSDWLYAHNMVRFTVLASGSKGNCTIVSGGRTRILVDCGLSCRELFRRMKLAGEEPETLDAIVITHEHSDHVAGVAVTARKLGIPVYFTEGYSSGLDALADATPPDDLCPMAGALPPASCGAPGGNYGCVGHGRRTR